MIQFLARSFEIYTMCGFRDLNLFKKNLETLFKQILFHIVFYLMLFFFFMKAGTTQSKSRDRKKFYDGSDFFERNESEGGSSGYEI